MQTLGDVSRAQAQSSATSSYASSQDSEVEYLDVARLRQQYNDYASAKDAEQTEMVDSRHYYHGDQWTADELKTLKARKQPPTTENHIVKKVNGVVGLVERLRQDVKAYPRTPQHDEGAELATATIRYVLDSNDWKSKSSRIAGGAAIDGIAGVEYDLVQGDEGDPQLDMHIVYMDGFFYDPRSFDEGFTDARYLGLAKWIDVEAAKDLFKDKAQEIDSLMDLGSDLTTVGDTDRTRNWINSNERKLRLADHWYIKGGKWLWCMYIGPLMIMQGVSPFIDERGKTFPRYRVFSASVDHDGDRYGFNRNLKSPQNEVNFRKSKALHLLNTRRIIAEKGAVDDIEVTRREAARADGFVEKNPGMELEFDDAAKFNDMKGQVEMLQEAKTYLENFGPNPSLIGQGLEDSSGRAIQLLQQAAIAELGPYLSAYKNWKIRVYRDIWNILQRYWTAERWIRVTDDQNVAQFFQINKMQLDQFGRPTIVNAIGSLDVDILIDEGPDAINMQADNMMVLQTLGPQFAQNFPDLAIELSPLSASVKKPMLDKIRAKQNQSPPPDPKVMALQAKSQLDQQGQQFDQQMQVRQQAIDERNAALEQQRKGQEAQQDMMLQRMQAMFDMGLQKMQAAADIQVERVKAAAQVQIQREKHDNDMDLARDKAAYQQQMARSKDRDAA